MEAISKEYKKQEKRIAESMIQLKTLISNILQIENDEISKPLQKEISDILEEMSAIPVKINRMCEESKGYQFNKLPVAKPQAVVALTKSYLPYFNDKDEKKVRGAIYYAPSERALVIAGSQGCYKFKNEALKPLEFLQMRGNDLVKVGYFPQVNAQHGFVFALKMRSRTSKTDFEITYLPQDSQKRMDFEAQKNPKAYRVTLDQEALRIYLTSPLQDIGKESSPQLFVQTNTEIQMISSLTEGTPQPEKFMEHDEKESPCFAVINNLFFTFLFVDESLKISPHVLVPNKRPKQYSPAEQSEFNIKQIRKFILREKTSNGSQGQPGAPDVELFIHVDENTIYNAAYSAEGKRKYEKLLSLSSSATNERAKYRIKDISFNEEYGALFLLLETKSKISTLKVKAVPVDKESGLKNGTLEETSRSLSDELQTRTLGISDKDEFGSQKVFFSAELNDPSSMNPLIFLCTDSVSYHYVFTYGEKGDEVAKTMTEFRVFKSDCDTLRLSQLVYNPTQKSLVMFIEDEVVSEEDEEMTEGKANKSMVALKGPRSAFMATLQIKPS